MKHSFLALAFLLAGGFSALHTSSAFAQHGHGAEVPHHGEAATGAHAHGTPDATHGDHGDHHVPTLHDVNWAYGFLGEKEGIEPNLLWRPTGMSAPVGALLLNFAVLFFLVYRFGKTPIMKGLSDRRSRIVKGIEDAQKMRDEAQASLDEYEAKLQQIEAEVERVRREMRAMGESERAKLLQEARDRQRRMEQDARILIEQETKATSEMLYRQVVENAIHSVRETLTHKLGQEDHRRLGLEYLERLPSESLAGVPEGRRA